MNSIDITENNKLIARFMGFTHEYYGPISRGGGVMQNVDLLSKIKFMTLPELISSGINNECAPFSNNGGICIGKYVDSGFYDNVVFFSTDSPTVPVTIKYNERVQAYHSSIEWLMQVVHKIESLVTLKEDGYWYSTMIGNLQTEKVNYDLEHPYWDALKNDESTELESPKIYTSEYVFSVSKIGKYSINEGTIASSIGVSKLDTIWNGVIDFIKWYNKQKDERP